MNSPRASGSEAIVVSASWLSEVGEQPYNLRGIATVMALAGFLKSMHVPVFFFGCYLTYVRLFALGEGYHLRDRRQLS